jgi:large subunit ribosomal protein L9
MKVILLEDVDALGKLGDTVNVKNGYARNYLIPRNLALPATARNLKTQAHKFKDIELKRSKIVGDAQSLADRIAGVSLTFNRKTGEKGRLFGSVTNMDIANALEEKGLTINRRDIVLPEPIKSLGEFDVQVKLHHDVSPVVKITVLPEEGEIPEGAMEAAPAVEHSPESPEAEPVEVAAPEVPEETPAEETSPESPEAEPAEAPAEEAETPVEEEEVPEPEVEEKEE